MTASVETAAAPTAAIATFHHGSGPVQGTVTFTRCESCKGTRVLFDLRGFTPRATHAVHIHEFGDTSRGCATLGDHWNPTRKRHGSIEFDGDDRHAGDLINNLTADARGHFRHAYCDPLVTPVSALFGRSVVIHAGVDDLGRGKNLASLTTGNAGVRLDCAVIGRRRGLHVSAA